MRIDVHAHFFPDEYLDRLDRSADPRLTAFIRKAGMSSANRHDLSAHFREMDPSQVNLQVLSISSQLPYDPRESAAVELARLANDIYAEVVREHPKRFAAFACTPLPHLQASIAEMRRALDELGMVGVTAGTSVLGKSIVDPAFDPFFVELNRRKAVLFIHPTGVSAGSEMIDSTGLTWPIGAPLEDTVCLLQFMQQDIPGRFPEIKIILPHLGGFAPFLMARLDELSYRFLPKAAPPPSIQAKRFWYDTVNAQPGALRCTQEAVGTERLLMGTDFPFWRGPGFKLGVDYVSEAGLSSSDVNRILGGNAQHLLGL